MNIIAYAYDSDVHCPDCTRDAVFFKHTLRVAGIDTERDERGIPMEVFDRENNLVHLIYDIDETSATHCRTCGLQLK